MGTTPDVSVIIVSYNTRELLRECIESILCAQGDDAVAAEVIVVDNASADGSAPMVAERFPQVRLIANADNRGFGAACNQGLEVARGALRADSERRHPAPSTAHCNGW
jgi:GT2 family glycosyltransferase